MNKAISLEKDFRLASAYIGLALCHSALGDSFNAQKQMENFVKMKPPSIPVWMDLVDTESYWIPPLAWNPVLYWIEEASDSKKKREKVEAMIASFIAMQKETTLLLKRARKEGPENVFRL